MQAKLMIREKFRFVNFLSPGAFLSR